MTISSLEIIRLKEFVWRWMKNYILFFFFLVLVTTSTFMCYVTSRRNSSWITTTSYVALSNAFHLSILCSPCSTIHVYKHNRRSFDVSFCLYYNQRVLNSTNRLPSWCVIKKIHTSFDSKCKDLFFLCSTYTFYTYSRKFAQYKKSSIKSSAETLKRKKHIISYCSSIFTPLKNE